MLSEYDVIKRLWDRGHFFSLEALAVRLVAAHELHHLSLSDTVVRGALRSYQRFFRGQWLSRLAQHGRRPQEPDGQADAATLELLDEPRCSLADYPHPAEGPQEASWPVACRDQITTSYRLTLQGLTDAQVAEVWQRADQNWVDCINVGFIFQPQSYPNTRIYAFSAQLSGNTLADQYLATNNCAAKLQGRVDSDRTWTEVLLLTTLSHEHGHALGLNHLQDPTALMYPSITQASMDRRGAPNESDVQAAVQLGYTRRTTPPPQPPPDGGTVALPASGTYRAATDAGGKVVITFNP